jgi:glycosyltransferase involved in cell wall biosynthesis
MTTWHEVPKRIPLVPNIGIVTLVPRKWHAPWSTQHHLMNRLAHYFPIAWVDPPIGWRKALAQLARFERKVNLCAVNVPEGILIHDPAWLPKFYRPKPIAMIVDRLRLAGAAAALRRRGCRYIVLYLWLPDFASALDLVPHDLSCYHIDDEYTFSTVEQPVPASEEALIRRADQIIIHSPALFEKKGHLNPRTIVVPNGVDFDAYSTPRAEPVDMRMIPRPRMGYTGMIKTQMDFPLLLALARRHPDWSFVFVGPRHNVAGQESLVAELVRHPNVYMMGGRPVTDLPAYVQHFDSCMLCYAVNDYTKFIYPLKLHEYLATGRPVVGSPIRTLQDFRHVISIASGPDEWSRALTASLDAPARSAESVRARQDVARSFDWGRHAGTIARTFCERLGVKWAESLE